MIMKNIQIAAMLATLSLLYGCSVQTNFLNPKSQQERDGFGTRESSEYSTEMPENLFSKNTVAVEQPPAKPPTQKIFLCRPFVVPELSPRPKVNPADLNSVGKNDHSGLSNLLLNNIHALNQHAIHIEEKLQEAYRKHRESCRTREVLQK